MKVELKGKRVLVIGLARTGVATALFCAPRGAAVSATDIRSAEQLGDVVNKLSAAGVRVELGVASEADLAGQELVIPSPGVPGDAPLLQQARSRGIPVWSEIELASHFMC